MKRALVLLLAAVAIGIVILKVRARSAGAPSPVQQVTAAQPQPPAPAAGQHSAPSAPQPLAVRPTNSPVPARLASGPPSPPTGTSAPAPPAVRAVVARADPAAAASALARPLLAATTAVAVKPTAPEPVLSAGPAPTADAVTAALARAEGLMKERKYVEARALLSKLYLESRGAQAARLREVLDRANKELVFNPRCMDGAVVHVIQPGESLTTIAKKYHLTSRALKLLNGMTGDRIRAGRNLKVVPGPASAVAYKSEFRMALFLNNVYVKEYPIGIGKDGSETPSGDFVVDNMLERAPWTKPEGGVVRYGEPGYQLGERSIGFENRSGQAGLGIHGTNDDATVGTKCSNGCLRMRNADVTEFYDFIHPGSRVAIRD